MVSADSAAPRTSDARLDLMRRRLAERGLASASGGESGQAAGTESSPVDPTVLSDGQRRMWFVQGFDPSGVLLNICLSYRLDGVIDAVAPRHALAARSSGACHNPQPNGRRLHESR